jgi:predicted metal-dependent hydrolase
MNDPFGDIDISFATSIRARSIRISVRRDGSVRVTAPRIVSMETVRRFVADKADWILAAVKKMKRLPPPLVPRNTRVEYLRHKERARTLAIEKLAAFNQAYGFSYRRIAIRNQRTRWGSCSGKGNLSFNYRIALLPEHLAEYVILHELCHLGRFDHSAAFWTLVERTMPDHKARRKELRRNYAL